MILLPLIFSLQPKRMRNHEKNMIPIKIFFLTWVLLLCCRDSSVGIDLENYQLYFDEIKYVTFKDIISLDSGIEKGYLLYEKLVSVVCLNFNFFIAITAVLSVLPLYKLYLHESEMPLLTIALFLVICPFPIFFSGLRQSIAIAFCPLIFRYVREAKPLAFVISVIVASLFHTSALVMLIMYPLFKYRIGRKGIIFIAMLGVVCFFLRNNVFLYLLNFVGSRYGERYAELEQTGAYMILILLILLLVYAFIISDKKKEDSTFNGLRNILVLCVFIQIFASVNNQIMRVNYYFLIFIPLLMSKVVKNARRQYKSIAAISTIIMVIFFLSYFIYQGYNGADALEIYPYTAFWSISY